MATSGSGGRGRVAPRKTIYGGAISGSNPGGVGYYDTTPGSPDITSGFASQGEQSLGNPWGLAASDPGDSGTSMAAAPYNPDTDPVYQAYIASLDLTQAQRQAETARRKEYLLADQTRALDDAARGDEVSNENLAGGYESRGVLASGAYLKASARQTANQGARDSRIRESTTRGITDAETQLANQLAQAQLQRQNARLGIFS